MSYTPNFDKTRGWTRFLALLLAFIVITGILYFVSCLAAASLNPLEWHWLLRTIDAMLMVGIIGFIIEKA